MKISRETIEFILYLREKKFLSHDSVCRLGDALAREIGWDNFSVPDNDDGSIGTALELLEDVGDIPDRSLLDDLASDT